MQLQYLTTILSILVYKIVCIQLSDISDYEDYMVTSSDEEILGMEEVPY